MEDKHIEAPAVPARVQVVLAAALIVCLLAGLAAGSALTVRALARQLPAAQAPVAEAREAGPVAAHRRLIVSGDTLLAIAIEEGVPMSELMAANPHISDPDLIFAGSYLEVPGH